MNFAPPRSKIYDDIYFSTENGLEESKAVFLEGIEAPDVWKGRKKFTICELGFGTGLNFLNTVKLWLEISSNDQVLNYVATEKHPLEPQEIDDAIHWSELNDYMDEMLAHYLSETKMMFEGRVILNVMIGDSFEMLSSCHEKIDAWYLDGFAPSKNPDMWSSGVFSELARLSNIGAKLATFTAAGDVRRGLGEVGFKMCKRKGYGKKREMLSGKFEG